MTFPPSRSLFPLGLIVGLFLFVPAPVPAAEVVILAGEGFPGAEQIAEAFIQGFKGRVTKTLVGESGPDLSNLLRQEQPRLLVVLGRQAEKALPVQPSLPIVFCDEGAGKTNLSGPRVVRIGRQVSVPDQFQAFSQLAPAPARIGVVYQDREIDPLIEKMKEMLTAAGRELLVFHVSGIKEVPQAMRAALEQSDALWLLPDPKVVNEVSRQYILMLAFNYRKPILALDPAMVQAGAALGIVPDEGDIARQALAWAERLLQGQKAPAQVIVPGSRLVVNSKVLDYFRLALNP